MRSSRSWAKRQGLPLLARRRKLREPAALILYGPLAADGKSQLLQLMRGLVSPGAAAAVSPNTFSDERRLVLLAGRALNACDELGGKAIFSDAFKCIISCEPTGARAISTRARSTLPHCPTRVFAANELPAFHRGLDRGVQRRVIIVPMTRVVPATDQVPRIAARILETEPDLALAWAVAGARRALARLDLARPKLCVEAKSAWIAEGDVVLSWLFDEEEVGLQEDAWTPTRSAYEAFRTWATPRGFVDLPDINAFSRRVSASGLRGVRSHRKSAAAGIAGIVVRRARVPRMTHCCQQNEAWMKLIWLKMKELTRRNAKSLFARNRWGVGRGGGSSTFDKI